jgi:hypothetical protein
MQFSSLLSAENVSSSGSFSGLNFLAIIVIFVLLLILFFAFLLIIPFCLSLNIRKKGPLLQGGYRLTWLGLTLKKAEIMPQSASDLLASIWKEEAEKEELAIEEKKSKGEEKGKTEKEDRDEKIDRDRTEDRNEKIDREVKDREQEGKGEGSKKKVGREAKLEERSEIDNSKDNQKAGIVRPPKIQSLINAAPALANILLDLLKSILFKKISCRLCFGLDDPAQTAIISGYLWSLASVLGLIQSKIFIEPWFEGERLEGELVAEIEARLWWTVFAVIQGLREREIRLLLREMLGRA